MLVYLLWFECKFVINDANKKIQLLVQYSLPTQKLYLAVFRVTAILSVPWNILPKIEEIIFVHSHRKKSRDLAKRNQKSFWNYFIAYISDLFNQCNTNESFHVNLTGRYFPYCNLCSFLKCATYWLETVVLKVKLCDIKMLHDNFKLTSRHSSKFIALIKKIIRMALSVLPWPYRPPIQVIRSYSE